MPLSRTCATARTCLIPRESDLRFFERTSKAGPLSRGILQRSGPSPNGSRQAGSTLQSGLRLRRILSKKRPNDFRSKPRSAIWRAWTGKLWQTRSITSGMRRLRSGHRCAKRSTTDGRRPLATRPLAQAGRCPGVDVLSPEVLLTTPANNPCRFSRAVGCDSLPGVPVLREDAVALSVETRVRPKLLTDLSPETAKLIEDLTFDSKGRAVPKLYSKLQANKELRAMLNISAKEAPRDVTQLSDAELIQTLAQQAKELGIEIDLNYTFHKPKNDNETENR